MVKLYPFPKDESYSDSFDITVDGTNVKSYLSHVSAVPFNQVWPGYQRPFHQTEFCSFVSFGMEESVILRVKPNIPFEKVQIRPLSKNIVPHIENGTITFSISVCGQYTLELDGYHNTLCIFANPIKEYAIKKSMPNVLYFAAGIHYPGKITLESNQTLFLEEGAIVHTAVLCENVQNVRILGHGILDNSTFPRGGSNPIRLSGSSNVLIDGVTIRDASEWSIIVGKCENIMIDNIKLIGMWRYNSDGVDFCNSANCVIKNSFLRNYDDCIVVKGLIRMADKNTENILAENCVLWCDWGRALEVGAETCAKEMRDIIFKDCDIIHSTHIAMDIQHTDSAYVHDVTFENIRAEFDDRYEEPYLQSEKGEVYHDPSRGFMPSLFVLQLEKGMWSQQKEFGTLHEIRFCNITVYSNQMPPSYFTNANDESSVSEVIIENLVINGRRIDCIDDANLHCRGNFEQLHLS
jgi:Endopolygalacturonase